jgi:hypothetical protein
VLPRRLWASAIGLWVSRCHTRRIPSDIANSEVLVRAVFSYHLDKGKPRPTLFRNPDDLISVSRRAWVAPWLTKLIARARIENERLERPNLYVGLAFVSAEDVRKHGATVVDSRVEYLGHADIRNGIVQPKGEALPPRISKTLHERAQKLLGSAKFVKDPDPDELRWTGSD